MNIKRLSKYLIRFLFLQSFLTYLTIFYFDNFLIPKIDLFPDREGYTFRNQIDANLLEDATRFFPWLNENFIKIDITISLFIFFFLVFLYSTKFYTYVNELSFSLDRNYLDEYFSIYLVWTSSLMIFVTLFRFSNLISRGYLVVLTFIVPIILLLFRNAEFLSSILGRSVTDENYLTFNLKDDSVFRKLRILTFRKELKNFISVDLNDSSEVIRLIDEVNKTSNVNLVVLNFEDIKKLSLELENYLINLNKKILIISKNKMQYNNYFINRSEEISDYNLTYFNNDIQYGSKYILKRFIDTTLSVTALVVFAPIFLIVAIYLFILDGTPVVIKQTRVGLHGQSFKMYKFRTMKNNSHNLRDELKELSNNDSEIFKIENDPRIIQGAGFLRKYSLDELPQFLNVFLGNMSVVGPRPLFEEDTLLFNESYMRRLNVLPGITGLLQINERNTSEFETWYKYDIEYIENWSLLMDMKIILKTPYSLIKNDVKGV
tara:strand:+ start:112 stop:1578 length:1467 start_codon:yes stop_codon:yes gene_type:complete